MKKETDAEYRARTTTVTAADDRAKAEADKAGKDKVRGRIESWAQVLVAAVLGFILGQFVR